MSKIFNKESIKFFIFTTIGVVIFCFLINLSFIDRIIFAGESGEGVESPVGWAWNNIFFWHSGSCGGSYYGQYYDYCGIDILPVLDVNFDSQDIDFATNRVRTPDSDIIGALYGITLDNVRNRTGNSNFNQSIYFDGASSYVDFRTDNKFNIFNSHSFSISVWFKLDSSITSDQYPVIFSNGDRDTGQYQCYVNNSKLVCNILGKSFGADVRELNKWYNLTITYSHDDKSLKAYLGSNLDSNGIATVVYKEDNITFPARNNRDLYIGRGIIAGLEYKYFKGEIDEFRLFQDALTGPQVAHNMKHNSNYSVKVDSSTGDISGYIWNQGLGWICLGETCSPSKPPKGGFSSALSDTRLNWQGDINKGIYPNMVTGWAKLVNSDKSDSAVDREWISLQGNTLPPAQRDYSSCVGCVTRDREDGLVGYWKFDEGSGDLVMDSSGFSRNGNINNLNENNWVLKDCVLNNCFFPKNEKNYVNIKNIDEIGGDNFSFEVWVKLSGVIVDKNAGILELPGKDPGFQIYFDLKTKSIEIKFLDKIITANADIILDKNWHQIIFTADRSGYGQIYLDTIAVGTPVYIKPLALIKINGSNLVIGGATLPTKDPYGSVDDVVFKNWSGEIDVVRMYKKVLSQEEIDYNYKYIEKKNCSACFDIKKQKDSSTENICYECNVCYYDQDAASNASNFPADSFYKCNTCSRCHKYGLVFDSNSASIKGYAWGGKDYGWIKFGPSLGSGIYRSYMSGMYGNVYSAGNIGSTYSITPPSGFYNASYLIQANGHLINWSSESSVTELFPGTEQSMTVPNFNPAKPWLNYFGNPRGYTAPAYDYPSLSNDYGNILGKIDYNELKKLAAGNTTMPWDIKRGNDYCLGGKVYYSDKDYVLKDSILLKNGNELCLDASGVILIEGDLEIHNNISYDSNPIKGSYKNLASVAWIIKGDLKISGKVKNLAGTFIVLGKDDVDCGVDILNPNKSCGTIYTGESKDQLKISGQVIAKNFLFQRTYKDILKSPAELIMYDGRNIVNPPKGLEDVVKALPRWDQIAPY